MTPIGIALSRFGYGLGPGGFAPENPRTWLIRLNPAAAMARLFPSRSGAPLTRIMHG